MRFLVRLISDSPEKALYILLMIILGLFGVAGLLLALIPKAALKEEEPGLLGFIGELARTFPDRVAPWIVRVIGLVTCIGCLYIITAVSGSSL